MPEIPTYTSKLLPPVARLPRAPMGNPALRALGEAGSVVERIGDAFTEQALQTQRSAEIGSLTSSQSQKLLEYRQKVLSSPEFFAHPEKASNDFALGVKNMGQETLKGIKDPVVRKMFTRYWAHEALRNFEHVSGLASAQRNNLAVGQLQGDIIKWQTMAEQTPDEKEGLQFLGRGLGTLQMMQKRGLIKPEKAVEQAQKMKSEFAESRVRALVFQDPQAAIQTLQAKDGISSLLRPDRAAQLEEMAQKQQQRIQSYAQVQQAKADRELETTQNNLLYNQLKTGLPNDPNDPKWDAAIEMAQKPPAGKLTVDPMGQSDHVAKQLTAERERLQHIQSEKQKQIVKNFSDWMSGQQAKGDPPSRDAINAWKDPKTGEGIPANVREKALAKIGNHVHTDRQALDSMETGIEARPFDKEWPNRVHEAYLDKKIGEKEKIRLLRKITRWSDPIKSPTLQAARDEYYAKYGDHTLTGLSKQNNYLSGSPAYKRFIEQFENLVAQQDLKPSQYREQADKMMADVDKGVINGLFSWHGGTAGDYYKFWGSWPEPRVNEQSVTRPLPASPSDVENIPTDKREEYIAELKKARMPINARNIHWFHHHQEGQ